MEPDDAPNPFPVPGLPAEVDPELVPDASTSVQVVVHARPRTAVRNAPCFISCIVRHRNKQYELIVGPQSPEGRGFALREISPASRLSPVAIPFDYRDPETSVRATVEFMQDIRQLDFLALPRLPMQTLVG